MKLLTMVILAEAALLLALSFKTHTRKPVMMALDRFKQGRGPVIVRTIKGTFFAVLISSVHSILELRHRSIHAGSLNPTDQVLLAEKTLEASLTGLLLFLSMVIDRLHPLIRERGSLEEIIEAEEKQLERKTFRIAVQLNTLEIEVATLKAKIEKLAFERQRITNKAEAAKAIVFALKKQSEGFHLEYDRLLEYNQTLQNQLQSIDQRLLEDNRKTQWTDFLKSSKILWGVQTPNESRPELGSENDTVTCHQLHFSSSHATSWPRHRRPIYQH